MRETIQGDNMTPIVFDAALPLRMSAGLMDYAEAFLYGFAKRTAAMARAFTAGRNAYRQEVKFSGLRAPNRKEETRPFYKTTIA